MNATHLIIMSIVLGTGCRSGPGASGPGAPGPAASSTPGSSASSPAGPPAEPVLPIAPIDDGLWAMSFDGSEGKSTVVEFGDFIALIEVPLRDEGGGATVLSDEVEGGERIIRALRHHFPDKPLRYVLSSHWHPHSLSALGPFLDAGATIVTTRHNYERLASMREPPSDGAPDRRVHLVEQPTWSIEDGVNRIVVHRFERKQYRTTPSDDYLYFELPRYQALHTGCMYSRWDGGPVAGRELVTGRELDLHRFLVDRGLQPRHLLRIVDEPPGRDERLPFARLDRVVREGIRGEQLVERYRGLSVEELRRDRERLVADAVADNIPPSLFNGLAYAGVGARDLVRALEFATLQVLVNPTDPNAWDTLGEIHYFRGQRELARTYQRTSLALDPEFGPGGEEVWARDLEAYQARGSAAPAP